LQHENVSAGTSARAYSGARVLEEKRAPGAAPAATMLLADAVRKMRDRFALKATEVLLAAMCQ